MALFSCGKGGGSNAPTGVAAVPEILVASESKDLKTSNNTLYKNNALFEGMVYELFPTSTDTASIESYLQGKLHGRTSKWYPNGQLKESRMYANGRKQGKQVAYWQNGLKRFEFMAVQDAYEGELREWNVAGNLIHLATFENGQEEGTQKMWYDNGKIRANYVMVKGRRYGLLGTKNCENVSDSIFVVD